MHDKCCLAAAASTLSAAPRQGNCVNLQFNRVEKDKLRNNQRHLSSIQRENGEEFSHSLTHFSQIFFFSSLSDELGASALCYQSTDNDEYNVKWSVHMCFISSMLFFLASSRVTLGEISYSFARLKWARPHGSCCVVSVFDSTLHKNVLR